MLAAEIIAIGSELLMPQFRDTNSLYLTEELNAIGIPVNMKTIVGDDETYLEQAVRGLESETSWQKETIGGLQGSLRVLQDENAWRRETVANLETQVTGLREAGQAAARAHEDLLSHHRELVRRLSAELLEVAALSIFRLRQGRRRLVALAGLLRQEAR